MLVFLFLLVRHHEIQILESKDAAFHTAAVGRAELMNATFGLAGAGNRIWWLLLMLLDWHDSGDVDG